MYSFNLFNNQVPVRYMGDTVRSRLNLQESHGHMNNTIKVIVLNVLSTLLLKSSFSLQQAEG